MKTILLQIDRLRRHYDAAVRTYDEVSLLDLSHSLRIWTELKRPLETMAPKFSAEKLFKTALPARKVLKSARDCSYVFAYMPGGVITYASHGNIISGPEITSTKEDFTVAAAVKRSSTYIEMKNFCYVSKAFGQPLIKALEAETVKRCTFGQWLGSEAVRVSYLKQQTSTDAVSISREIIIKRVANTLDGSHPSSMVEENKDNKFDAPIQHLLRYTMAGLPLPYFILLKIAQDILEVAPRRLTTVE